MDKDLRQLKIRVTELATRIAQEESERTGITYNDCIGPAVDKACKELGVGRESFIKMYL